MAKTYTVQSTKDGGWAVLRQGKKSPESKHRKKELAVKKGRSMAKRAKGILKIKSTKGRIQAVRKYTK